MTTPLAAGAAPADKLTALPTTQTSSLERYLAQIPDPTLRENLAREIAGMGRTFGLVFERHHPEGIRLPKHQVKRGSKVIINTVKNSGYYRVARLAKDDGTAVLVDDEGNEAIYPVDQLTVAKEFGDVMYPGLRKLSEVRRGAPDAPVHTIINGENYHALEALQYTHSGKVDLIYIDPPYNTGNADWKYNDRYIDSKDGYRHSKWLSFMEKRLLIAKQLLKPTGVIIMAIDDNEHHRLRMLADTVFGEGNFIADLVWDDKGSNLSKFTSGGVDYMLVYGRDADLLDGFRDIKKHAPELVTLGAGVLEGRNREDVQGALREYLKANKEDLPKGVSAYRHVDDQGRVYCTTNMDNSLYRPNLKYQITDPATGTTFDPPAKGWTVQPSTLKNWMDEGRVLFTKSGPIKKVFLHEAMDVLPSPVFNSPRIRATKHLKTVMGDKRFPFPKDHEVLMRWFRMVVPENAVILDFFGGSGTTAEAVIRLNGEDGGTRQAILVTNNELSKKDDAALRMAGHAPGDAEYEALGVFHHVTKPRLETVITGTRPDGSTYSEGLAANAAFFELTYLEEPEIVTGRALEDLAGLFWLKSGGSGGTVEINAAARRDGYAISESGAAAILFTPGRARALAEQLKSTGQVIGHLFIVTDSDAAGDEAASHFPLGINVERIYGSYLEAFQVNRKD
ncbi:site-specific DNA-methyltransferase [Arthrobacter caoxuetaonis]|uniref:Site-specific DNA-methyltransferase n=1 Tax=Arthrobacter caoxuetaonis TaxID=2886935 RepID=A0A9X1MHG2_9MICC|nr:site-specific DNA-methyltransferase [Arthrobacter caoxuetaonis]MCC3299295.1 site-specific DNA-methyltransferase [Arthrobacter caoxuetaonis]USQ59212.1 site-specific DNA-methyltransferase [Arthrobacter caoxuetaonis]